MWDNDHIKVVHDGGDVKNMSNHGCHKEECDRCCIKVKVMWDKELVEVVWDHGCAKNLQDHGRYKVKVVRNHG